MVTLGMFRSYYRTIQAFLHIFLHQQKIYYPSICSSAFDSINYQTVNILFPAAKGCATLTKAFATKMVRDLYACLIDEIAQATL